MALGTLYSYPDNFRAQKALIAAQYSGSKIAVAEGFKFGETNKSESFLAKFPLGMVPAFEASDGTCLFESNAIAYYVSNEQLRGSNHTEASLVQQWMNFADNEILPPACTWVYPCLGIIQYNKQDAERSKENLKLVLSVLDAHLLSRTFVVGERVTLADVVLVCDLLLPYQYVLEPAFREPYQNVNRWFTTMINQPQVKSVLGELKLCEKMAQSDGKKFAQIHGQQKKDEKKDKKPKAEPKKQPAKKAKEEKDDDDDADGVERELESKDPLDALPKGTFDLNAFKRCYSNEDTLTKAIPYFWENFDAENYSIWLGEYKYNNELTKIFMSCNLMGGMMQRVEKMKKNAFASLCLFGVENESTVSGLWIWRGHELAFTLCDDWQIDYDVYAWKKLDPTTPETKKLVNEYLAWEGDFDGKKFCQGKIFK